MLCQVWKIDRFFNTRFSVQVLDLRFCKIANGPERPFVDGHVVWFNVQKTRL